MTQTLHSKIVVVGAGTGGLTVAAQLLRQAPYLHGDLTIIDPKEDHYYQPFFTLVGAGDATLEESVRKQETLIPEGATWLQEAVTEFIPDENAIQTDHDTRLTYDYLVVGAGFQINWDGVKGLKETIGKNGVCSNYSEDYVESTWENIRTFNGGKAIFTQPSSPIKCAGAPQKIMYLADEYFRKSGVRHKSNIEFVSGMDDLFPVKHYYPALKELVKEKDIDETYFMDLVEIDGPNQKATFKHVDHEETITRDFDMIHVTPPMGPPSFIANSPIADEVGWVDLDMYTLRHTTYTNIFGVGDCTSLPTSRTGAAIRKQAPVVVENLLALLHDKEMTATYDGYSSCPVVTGYDTVMLAEFVYGYEAEESFPFDQRKMRKSMFLMKKYALPMMYWNGMLKGTM
ncbi:MAG TPA: FAD/NAD(P)-binding oxidoreductase [Bacillota bacterium]|nr:FAD/NAD(P)-binding oxidoreductase [Bacillota bacterium]